MRYPVNYNFGKNWKKKIVPILDDPKMIRAVKRLKRNYIAYIKRAYQCKNCYVDDCPSHFSSNDSHDMIEMEKDDQLIEQLRKDGKLTKKFIKIEKKYKNCNEEDADDIFEEYEDVKEDLLQEYHEWSYQKYQLESFFMCGGCHLHAPTIGLTMAKLVEPNEHWKIRTSDDHTTVINKEQTKVFDLLL